MISSALYVFHAHGKLISHDLFMAPLPLGTSVPRPKFHQVPGTSLGDTRYGTLVQRYWYLHVRCQRCLGIYMYIYVYIYTYIHIYIYTYTYIYIYTFVLYIYIYILNTILLLFIYTHIIHYYYYYIYIYILFAYMMTKTCSKQPIQQSKLFKTTSILIKTHSKSFKIQSRSKLFRSIQNHQILDIYRGFPIPPKVLKKSQFFILEALHPFFFCAPWHGRHWCDRMAAHSQSTSGGCPVNCWFMVGTL